MSDFTFDFTIFLISYYLFHFFATVWTTTMVIFSKKKTVIIILNMMCFNLHLYFKVFYTNLSFMEQFYIKKKNKTIALLFFGKFINKTPCRIQIGYLRVISLVLFPQNMIIQQIIHSGVRSKLKELNDSSKKKSSKKKHPPPPAVPTPMYTCMHVRQSVSSI